MNPINQVVRRHKSTDFSEKSALGFFDHKNPPLARKRFFEAGSLAEAKQPAQKVIDVALVLRAFSELSPYQLMSCQKVGGGAIQQAGFPAASGEREKSSSHSGERNPAGSRS
jgi:hypothetical protein